MAATLASFHHPWFFDTPLILRPSFISASSYDLGMVANFIQAGSWQHKLLSNLVGRDLLCAIARIPVNSHPNDDHWAYREDLNGWKLLYHRLPTTCHLLILGSVELPFVLFVTLTWTLLTISFLLAPWALISGMSLMISLASLLCQTILDLMATGSQFLKMRLLWFSLFFGMFGSLAMLVFSMLVFLDFNNIFNASLSEQLSLISIILSSPILLRGILLFITTILLLFIPLDG